MRRIVGQVVNGKFIKSKPKETNNREHQLHRQHIRDRMREDYSKDIIQPWKNGKPNEEYIEAYGKREAKQYFNIEGDKPE